MTEPSEVTSDPRPTTVIVKIFRARMARLAAKGWPQQMEIDKRKIVQVLRCRGQHDRAEWVDRELPDRIDTTKNAGILATLNLNPTDITDPMA